MTNRPEMTPEEFDDKYQGTPVWDIGRPQKAFLDAFARTPPQCPVLDAGCGSGDLSIYVASIGCEVLGIDFASTAVEKARQKALAAGSRAAFEVQDIFSLQDSDGRFKTVLDCCFFHVLDDSSRLKYERLLQNMLEPGGMVYMLCFAGQFSMGPRAVSQADIERIFGTGWSILTVESCLMEVTFMPGGFPGIFACLERDFPA